MKSFLSKIGEGLWVFVDQAGISGINFLNAIILTRLMGLDVYGQFVLLWMAVIFLSSVQQSLIIQPYFTLRSKRNGDGAYAQQLIQLQFMASLGILVLTFALQALWARFGWLDIPSNLILWTGITALLFIGQDLLRRLIMTETPGFRVLVLDIIAYGLQPLFWFLLWEYAELTVLSLMQFTSLLMLGSIVVGLVFLKPRNWYAGNWNVLKDHWSFGRYLFGTALLQWFSGNFFILLSAPLLGTVAVGALRIVQNLLGLLHIVFQALENILPSQLGEVHEREGSDSMLRAFWNSFRLYGFPVLLVLTLLGGFSPTVLRWVYGPEAMEYRWLLTGYCLLYTLVYSGTMLRFVLRTMERNHKIFHTYLITTTFSVLTAIPLVKAFGLYGVLIGLMAVQLLNNFFYYKSIKITS
jgi:O-antigen/teichoic acid export membrane protein